MPKIPIIPPREFRDRSASLGDGPEPLSPEQANALKAIEDRTARIDRELAVFRAWRAGVERMSEAEQTPGGAPVGFTRGFLDELDRERQQLVTGLPPTGQEPLERDLLDLRADFLDRAAQVEASGMALRRRTALYDALDGYVAGVTRDPGQIDRAAERMDSLIAGLGLPEDRHGAMRLFVKDALGNAAIGGLMQDPVRAEQVLSDGLYDDMLSASSKVLRLKEAQDKVAREQHLDRERTIANLTMQAHDGAASDEAIRDAERNQTLSVAEAAYLRETNAKAAVAASIRDARIQRVATATERLNPSTPEDRAAASAYWDSVSEVHASDDPKQQQANERRFVERTGVLPQALENKYRGALLSKDPAVAVQGAGAIAHLASLDPALAQNIPAEEVRRALAIDGYTSLGVEPDRAVELGDEKAEAESAQPAGPTRPGEIQVAANDEPPVMSDATETGVSEEGTAGPAASNDDGGVQPDGSAVIVDPETGEQTTVDRESVEHVRKLADDQAALTAIRERFLEIYDAVASKKITREEATTALRAILDASDGPVVSDPMLRKELERVASDIPYAVDREAAFNVFTQRVLAPERRIEIGREILSLLPIVGEGISAADAYEAFSAALEAWDRGDSDEALRQAGEGGLATLGALPLAGGAVRLTRGGIAIFRAIHRIQHRVGRSKEKAAWYSMPRGSFDTALSPKSKIMGQLDPLDPTSVSIPNHSGRLVLDQGTEPTCAVHCGAMLLDTFGKTYDIEVIKKLSSYSELLGTSVFRLAPALRKLGLRNAHVVENLNLKDLAKRLDEKHPAIAGIEVKADKSGATAMHGVIVDKIEFKSGEFPYGLVYIRDPAGGREYVSFVGEFEQKFLGIAIVTTKKR